MSLTVPLRLYDLGATRIPTETTLLWESAALAVIVSEPDQLLYDIIHGFIDIFVVLVVVSS